MSATYYRRWLRLPYLLINPIFRFLVLRFGLDGREEQDGLRILRVRGRKSGRLYDIPVRLAVFGGRRYILSMLGEAQWVRNLRAGGGADLITGQKAEHVQLREAQGEEKGAFLTWYVRQPAFAQRARYALSVADPQQIQPEELARLVDQFPVFRVDHL